MKKLVVALACLALAACASNRPKDANDYNTQFDAPIETDKFIFLDKHLYDDPMAGIMLRYADKDVRSDIISVYVYPIASTSWEDVDATLTEEMDSVLKEVDYAVEQGVYQSRGEAARSDYAFTENDIKYTGKKAEFTFVSKNGTQYDSNAYLFLSEDKFIKFRTSFHAEYTPDWNGDGIVKELLPGIKAPPESKYMSDLREQHRQQMANNLLNLLLQAAANDAESKEKSD